jgi:hypothetical protein
VQHAQKSSHENAKLRSTGAIAVPEISGYGLELLLAWADKKSRAEAELCAAM